MTRDAGGADDAADTHDVNARPAYGGAIVRTRLNKAVKDGLKNRARREEKEKEMAALRMTWAAERAERDASRARRDATRDAFRKKNKRGQPVMRHRVDKILERLRKDTTR